MRSYSPYYRTNKKTLAQMSILIAEDENDIASIYKETLESRNHRVTITSNGEDCLKAYHDAFQEMISSHTETMGTFSVTF